MSGLEALIARLEVATTRLESLASNGGASGAAAAGPSSAVLEAYDEVINGPLKNFIDHATKIGGAVAEHASLFQNAFKAQRDFLAIVIASKQPSDAVLQDLLKGTSQAIQAVTEYRDANRGNRDAANHLAALAEGVPALGWVLVPGKPAPHVTQLKESAEFYSMRVLKEFKDKDENHANWAKAVPQVFNGLFDFVKQHFTTGLVWNPKGVEAKAGAAPAPAAAAKPAAAPAAAPAAKPAAAAAPNFFAELKKGDGVTAGLKKVDKSQMTHKNPELRSTSVVKAAETPAAPAKVGTTTLNGNKWEIEHHTNNREIVVEDVETKHTVYVYKCTGSTIVIKGKVNQVTLDSCKKTAIVLESVISGVEVVNCQSVQVQITQRCPTVNVDKTDGMQLFISHENLDVELLTAKTSELNIVVAGKTENDDPVETPIPEQFKTVFNTETNAWVTDTVKHSA